MNRNVLRFLFAMAALAGIFVLLLLMESMGYSCFGPIRIFLNLPAFLLVFGGGFFLTLVAYPFQEIGNGFRALFKEDAPPEDIKAGMGISSLLAIGCPTLGLVGAVMGLIFMLADLGDPQVIAKKMAVTMTSTFFGIAASIFAFAVHLFLRRKLEKISPESSSPATIKPSRWIILPIISFAGVIFLLLTLFILLFGFSEPPNADSVRHIHEGELKEGTSHNFKCLLPSGDHIHEYARIYYRGVHIGNVSEFKIIPDGVQIEGDLSPDVKIRKGDTVRVVRDRDDAFLEITPGPVDSPILAQGEVLKGVETPTR